MATVPPGGVGTHVILARAASLSLVALVTLHAPEARAQNAANQAAAEALFDQGKAAMATQSYAIACPKFFESNRLDEGIGTTLWLAECYEKNGQTASAWAQFRQAAALAVKTSDPREKVARERSLALDKKLARLVLVVPPASRVPGLRVARDGGEVFAALWGVSVPADPGRHTIVASAPDHRPLTLTIEIVPGPSEQSVIIPLLADAPAPPAPSPEPEPAVVPVAPSSPPPSGPPIQRIAGVAVTAAGVVSAGVATYFGFHAKSELDASNAGPCHANNLCTMAGVTDRSSAESAATASTVLFVVAGAALVGGAALWLTAPRPSSAPASASLAGLAVTPWLDPRGGRRGGVVLRAEF